MTDRVKGFTVTLEKDVRTDDFEYILNAVQMIRGVQSINMIINDGSEYITLMKRDAEIREKLYDFIKENL